MKRIPIVCRVCGREFIAPRWDAVTCTDTCRQRLCRGGEFAYFAELSPKEQRLARAVHDADDVVKVARRNAAAARTKVRALKRVQRARRAEAMRDRIVAEAIGHMTIAENKRKREQGTRATVAGLLKLFTQERRNDMSAEAMAEVLAMPDSYPAEAIAVAIDQLRTSGDYDRIVRDAGA